ncbi:hypothetical protein HB825_05460 [Listeria booriae]|uniref:hypothetical protein n=1 Tax=Listeria booriae TaxID=1552123 RepID=UPI00164ECA25|nr:hypothetical protein [Listeria booriae]MBC6134284.1 hypothetical protein [Listeria booriae]
MTVKYKCEAVREDRFIVELDEQYFDEAWFEHFNEHFYNHSDLAEIAEFIASVITRLGTDTYIGGIGVPLLNGETPYGADSRTINAHVNIVATQEIGDQECGVLVWEVS